MRIALTLILLVVAAIAPPVLGQEIRRVSTCFEESIAALRLSQLEQGIAYCDQVIEDKAVPSDRRGQALAQRGLMYARRWSIVVTPAFAVQGIADITEALRLHVPAVERKHQLLLVRAQLYVATGQTRRASRDYTAILDEDPNNTEAVTGRNRIGPSEGF